MSSTPNITIPLLSGGQATAYATHNEGMAYFDGLMFCALEDRNLSAAPGAPSDGQIWLVDGTPAGGDAWEGQGGKLALYSQGWYFIAPKEGFFAWVKDEDVLLRYDGTNWISTGDNRERMVLVFTAPSAGDEALAFYADRALTFTQLRGVLPDGTSTPSITFDVRYGTDRSAAGTAVKTSGFVVTNTTTGATTATFDNDTVPAGNWCWVEIDAKSGTVPMAELEMTLKGG